MTEWVFLPVLSDPGAEAAARLPGPQPEHLSTQAQRQTGSPRDQAHNLLHPGCWVLRGRAEATAMLPGAWGESRSATTLPPQVSLDTGEIQLPANAPSHQLPSQAALSWLAWVIWKDSSGGFGRLISHSSSQFRPMW